MSVLEYLKNKIISPDQLLSDGVPSASIAILENDSITTHVITKGHENAETVYQACSISKAITALAVAKLVDEQTIAYETKAIDHLPESILQLFVEEGTRHLMEHVTIEMLLSHTSGLSQGGFPGYDGTMPSEEDILRGHQPSNTPKLHFMSFPGAQFSYSGGGYLILQLVLEDVTKLPFSELMHKVVLEPAGMTRSWFGAPPSEEVNLSKAHYTGFVKSPGGAEYHRFVELAAAGLWSTPSDLLRAVAIIQESLSTRSGFLKRETAKKMLTKVKSLSSTDGIALGWFLNEECFAHTGGNDPGYNTYVLGFRDRTEGTAQRGISVMTNSSLGHDVCIKQIVNAIFYLKGWSANLASYSGRAEFIPYAAPASAKLPEEWRDWIGQWDSEWWLLDRDGPVWKYRSMEPFRLHAAADARKAREIHKQELSLIVDKLKIGLTLTWDGDIQVIRLLQVEERILKRTDSHEKS